MIQVLKVCKECLESGTSLPLSRKLLCKECEWLAKHDRPLIQTALSFNIHNVERYNNAYEEKRKREERNFGRIFSNLMQGKALEKQGQTDEALEIYIKTLSYLPPGTDYYKRPCILLEKKKDYEKAIEICDLAIKCIKENRFKADTEEFEKRRKRLSEKLEKLKK